MLAPLLALTLVAAPPAPRVHADPAVALTLTGVAVAGTIAATVIITVAEKEDVDLEDVPELIGFDESLRGRWSLDAHALSNATLIGALSLPLVAHAAVTGPAQEDAFYIYGETLSSTVLLNTVAKRLFERRRPYTYGDEGRARRKAQGTDAYLSFYSGHAAASFAAATSGAMLMTLRTDDVEARAVAWSLGMASAAATAVMRVRAGRHFPTDVVVGAIMGTAAGLIFPLLHAEGELGFGAEDALAAAGGLAGGLLFGILWPVDLPGTAPPVAVGPADADGGVLASIAIEL